jgi:hypothetical protein
VFTNSPPAITDGHAQTTPLTALTYSIGQRISEYRLQDAFFNHYWDQTDSTEVVIQAQGSLDGYQLNNYTLAPPLANGLAADINNTTNPAQAEVSGPPTLYQNSEARFPLQVLNGATQVAVISRPYSLLAHNDSAAPGDVGTITSFTRTYLVNDFVALNPRKPYWNSPDVSKIPSFTPAPGPVNLTAQVAAASALPTGLSLDANTGLIYGILLAPYIGTTVIQYVDSSNLVHGTVTITWSTLGSAFTLVDQSGVLNDLQTGTVYTGLQAFKSNGVTITGVSVVNPSSNPLPVGLSVSTDGTYILVSGTPTEAGYFDVWFEAASANNGTAYAHARISIDYIVPLAILTTTLPTISSLAYSVTLTPFGGIPPYSWGASDTINGPWLASGVNLVAPTAGNFLGLQLNTAMGVLSGTLSPLPVTNPSDLGNITFTLSDTRGNTIPPAVTAALDLTYNNSLLILTPAPLGIATISADPTGYGFEMTASGGVPPYKWQMAVATLPTGISFTATAPTLPATATLTPSGGGWFYGTAGVTVSNISENAGNVVTLGVVANNLLQVGDTVLLSGLTVGTWLNGQTVTLIAPTNSTTLTFNDPTSHGTQVSTAETGTAAWNGGTSSFAPVAVNITVTDSTVPTPLQTTGIFNVKTGVLV